MAPLQVHHGAEAFSFWTHGVGALAAVAGLVFLLLRADGPREAAALAVYGATLVALLSASTLHHAVQTAHGHERSGILRRLDHVSIYLFIAGTYTPVCLLGLPAAWGLSLLAVVWGMALVGIALKLFLPFAPRWLTSAVYVLMGWIVVAGAGPMLEAFPADGLLVLLAGGIVYTLGAVGYALRKPDLWPHRVGFHGVWHVLVLVGASLHFGFIAAYL